MKCPHCRLSLETLKRMQKTQEEFYTLVRNKKLLIADVDERNQKIRMIRSTGKTTWALKYSKLVEIHDLIHDGHLNLDQYAIAKEAPTWGTYIAALLQHLGTKAIGSR